MLYARISSPTHLDTQTHLEAVCIIWLYCSSVIAAQQGKCVILLFYVRAHYASQILDS